MGAEWMHEARCRELSPKIFFPTEGVGVAVACTICSGCPVKEECLEYAISNNVQHGVWGGASERKRRRVAARRRQAEHVALRLMGVTSPADR